MDGIKCTAPGAENKYVLHKVVRWMHAKVKANALLQFCLAKLKQQLVHTQAMDGSKNLSARQALLHRALLLI